MGASPRARGAAGDAARFALGRRVARGGRRLSVLLALTALVLLGAGFGAWRCAREGPFREAVEEAIFARRLAPYRADFLAAGAEFGLDPYLLAAMAAAESSVRPSAESKAGALGLMQLRLATAADMARSLGLPEPSREDLLGDPGLNIRLGASYMAWLLPRQGRDVERALMAYNTGPTRLNRWIAEAGSFEAWRERADREGPARPGSVRHYAARVLTLAEHLRAKAALG